MVARRRKGGPRPRKSARVRKVRRTFRPRLKRRPGAKRPAGVRKYRSAKRQRMSYARKRIAGRRVSTAGGVGVPTRYMRVSLARPIPRRTLKLGFVSRVLRYQVMNTIDSADTRGVNSSAEFPPGAVLMEHFTSSTSTSTPFLFMVLNSTINNGVGQVPLKRVLFDNTGNLTLGDIGGQGPSTSNAVIPSTTDWSVEYESPTSADTPSVRHIMNAWYDVRLNLYGATAQDTTYDISVVSFVKRTCDPFVVPNGNAEAQDRHAFWQGMIRKYMAHPLLPAKKVTSVIKVHGSVRITIPSTQTTSEERGPNNRYVRLFIRDGSLYDYMYHSDGMMWTGADDDMSTVKWNQIGTAAADYSNYPASAARKFLMIRCSNTTRTLSSYEPSSGISNGATPPVYTYNGGYNYTNTPSLDILVRKGEYLSIP